MRCDATDSNECVLVLSAGETVHFGHHFLRHSGFAIPLVPSHRGALLARLLAGKLWECSHTAGLSEERVRIGGNDAHGHGRFKALDVPSGELLFVRLGRVAAYTVSQGGGYVSSRGLLDPIRWLTGTTFAVLLRGPCTVVFYGVGLDVYEGPSNEECFADQILAFDARVPFQVQGLQPLGAGGGVMNAFSNTVVMCFLQKTPLAKTTVRAAFRSNRFSQFFRLIAMGVFGGWLLEKVFFEDYIWSWMK